MESDKKNAFHIVAYCEGNSELAKARAKHIRNYILNAYPSIEAGRLPLSWFGVAEEIRRGERTYKLNDSIRFITVLKKEES
ncbi:hypothetical protein [Desulfovibrio sp. JC022]|uniref:hypothetical protein n=1 Tax=Desulfovibrio sp. JC022 TaxID=2593642 RepID=UPI001EF35DD7|nr:hypothetical protein [Desulfovibrio sp. JC022]